MLLRRLLILFGKIAAYTHLNKMTAATIATVFGPNLMFTKNLDPIESLKDSQAINELVYNLINYSSSIQWVKMKNNKSKKKNFNIFLKILGPN